MSNPELLDQLRQLSCAEKFQMMQFLMAELAKEEMLKPLDNGAAYRVWSPYDYGDAAQKLMSSLEQEETQENAKCSTVSFYRMKESYRFRLNRNDLTTEDAENTERYLRGMSNSDEERNLYQSGETNVFPSFATGSFPTRR